MDTDIMTQVMGDLVHLNPVMKPGVIVIVGAPVCKRVSESSWLPFVCRYYTFIGRSGRVLMPIELTIGP